MASNLHRLRDIGQSPWSDFLARPHTRGGDLERLVREDGVCGVTSNPTIFAKALAEGEAYDEQLRDAEGTPQEAAFELMTTDVAEACDVLRPVWDETGHLDGWVSQEVDPYLAHDAEGTCRQLQEIRERVARPNLFVKIPATVEGIEAIRRSIAAGASVNVTLIFSLQRHREVMEAYLAGLEELVSGGGDPSSVASVASFFVSRVDSEADRRLDEAGRSDLRGRLAIANARLAYANYREVFSGERWRALAERGARPQRCLWASTSTKDPSYRDVVYVEELIGPDTVNTMPLETIRAFQDHGEVRPALPGDVDEARRLLDDLAEAGIDYDDVTATLEREGVEKFQASFDELLGSVEAKARALGVTSLVE